MKETELLFDLLKKGVSPVQAVRSLQRAPGERRDFWNCPMMSRGSCRKTEDIM